MAGMTLLVELQHRMSRHVVTYFSMVRRNACWASFVKRSVSISKTTEGKWKIELPYLSNHKEQEVQLHFYFYLFRIFQTQAMHSLRFCYTLFI